MNTDWAINELPSMMTDNTACVITYTLTMYIQGVMGRTYIKKSTLEFTIENN